MSKKMIVFGALSGSVIAAVVAAGYFYSVGKAKPQLITSPSLPVQAGRAVDRPIPVLIDPKVDTSPSAAISEPITITRPGDVKPDVVHGTPVSLNSGSNHRLPVPNVTDSPARVPEVTQPQISRELIVTPSAQHGSKPALPPNPMTAGTTMAPPAPVAAPKSQQGVEAVIVSGQKPPKSVQVDPKTSPRGNTLTIQLPKRQQ